MIRAFLVITCLLWLLTACSDSGEEQGRSYRMGFANSAPRFNDFDLVIQSLNMWSTRADAAIISTEVPWEELIGGASPVSYVVDNYKGLAEFYRSKGFELWVYVDPQNGLDRTSDADELVSVGKSIADPDMQLLYQRFVVVMDSVLHPEHLGLALETNLIRGISTPAIYQGVKQAVNDAANKVKSLHTAAGLSVSVQVDYAWGKLGGGDYRGVEQDFIDFPFMDEIGLSSYPYFGFNSPAEIPLDYYSRLTSGKAIPSFISEGGWTSHGVSTTTISFASTPEIQEQYIRRQSLLLNQVKATAWFQLTFTDIDVASLPASVSDNIVYFAFLGLVDPNLQPKPALAAWDATFKTLLHSN